MKGKQSFESLGELVHPISVVHVVIQNCYASIGVPSLGKV